MKDPMCLVTGGGWTRMHVVAVLFAARHGNGSQISEDSLSLTSSRCGCLWYGKTMVTIYGSSDSRARRSAKAKRQETWASPAYGKRADESAGLFFTHRWERCVTKGISMTFMEQEKDDALKMIIATDAKHLYLCILYIHKYNYYLLYW